METENKKYRKAAQGYPLKVGDKVVVKHAFGKNVHEINRLTKTTAIADNVKFPCLFGFFFGYRPKGKWDNNDYEVYELI